MSGHGHVTPNPNGTRARCGGPSICSVCALEYVRLHSTRSTPRSTNIMQRLYDAEINATISWFWDGGFNVALGDSINGIRFAGNVDNWNQVAAWFAEHAARLYPEFKDAA